MYRGHLISNTKMFVIYDIFEAPLLSLDIAAWLMVSQMTGDLPVPNTDEMHSFNMETLLDCMNDPFFRYDADGVSISLFVCVATCCTTVIHSAPLSILNGQNYKEQWKLVCSDEEHWSNDTMSIGMKAIHRNFHNLEHRLLARDAFDSGYPLDLGTYGELNEKGKALVAIHTDNEYSRYEMDASTPDASWRTFRDCDPSQCRSIFTGTESIPLKGRWLELEGCEMKDIIGDSSGQDEECSDEICSVDNVSGSPTKISPTLLVEKAAKVHGGKQHGEATEVFEVTKLHDERQDIDVAEVGPSDRYPNSPIVSLRKSAGDPTRVEVAA